MVAAAFIAVVVWLAVSSAAGRFVGGGARRPHPDLAAQRVRNRPLRRVQNAVGEPTNLSRGVTHDFRMARQLLIISATVESSAADPTPASIRRCGVPLLLVGVLAGPTMSRPSGWPCNPQDRSRSRSTAGSGSRPSTTPARNCCSGSSPPYERRALDIASHWPFEAWAVSYPNTPPRSACSTGSGTTPTSWSPTASPTACAKPQPQPGGTNRS